MQQAAAIPPVNYLTACEPLVVMGSLKPEEEVLIHNAWGRVGLSAIDIVRHIRRRQSKGRQAAASMPSWRSVACKKPSTTGTKDWAIELKRLMQGKRRGAHHLSARRQSINKRASPHGARRGGSACLAFRWQRRRSCSGRCVMLPVTTLLALLHPIPLMNRNRSAFGVNLGDPVARGRHDRRVWMQILLKGVADGWVRPHVDKTFPLAKAGEAQTYMEERKKHGKVILIT